MAVYVWGFGKSGQLGNGQTDTQHTPVRPKLPTNAEVSDIHCGGYYTAVVSQDGQLFTFGCGKYGRLGSGNEEDRAQPIKISVTDENGKVGFQKVSCGIWHGAAIANDNNLYIWGYGKSHGVLGLSDTSLAVSPQRLNGPFSTKVSGVSCGNNFTLLWTTDGEAYSWGCGRHGVLGHGDTEDVHQPTIIPHFKNNGIKVVYMSAGFAHCGTVSSDGQLFMFGKGEDGALGLGSNPPKQVKEPKLVISLKDIKEVSCNVGEKHGHTLCVSTQSQVFAFGDGYKGKLGLGDQDSRWVPTEIPKENFNGEHIIHVSAGGIHSAAVSKEGNVFTWGCGSDGRLGHPDGKGHRYLFRSDVPRFVEGLCKAGRALNVSCSYYHSAALLDSPN